MLSTIQTVDDMCSLQVCEGSRRWLPFLMSHVQTILHLVFQSMLVLAAVCQEVLEAASLGSLDPSHTATALLTQQDHRSYLTM